MIAANDMLLRPHEIDPEQEERDRLFGEGRATQLAHSRAAHAEPSAEEKAERRRNMLERRRILLDQQEAEMKETLEEFARRLESEGDDRQAKIQRPAWSHGSRPWGRRQHRTGSPSRERRSWSAS
jgi:hypothetical protein